MIDEKDLSFVIPTYRLREVGTTVQEYDEHFWRNGHAVPIVVFDDSSTANQEKYYPLLEQIETHNEVYYVGPKEKEEFIGYLNQRITDKRLQGLVKSLFRPSYGGNRNCALMYTLGGAVVSADDDMRPYSLMEHSPESLEADEVCRGRLHRKGENGYGRKSFDILTSFMDVIFNPSLPSRLVHMVLAAYLTTAMVVAGASAFALLRGAAKPESRTSLRMAVLMMAVVAPLQIMAGHESGIVAGEYQPAKIAAMEGWWTTRAAQPTVLFGWPDQTAERTDAEVSIDGLGSWVNGVDANTPIKGLDAFAREDRPPVFITFWAFRIMVAMGLVMVGLGLWGAFAWLTKRLDGATLYQRALVIAAPSGFIAVLAGWITAEVGRQPYLVYGVLRTADGVSPVAAGSVAISLLLFIVVYGIVFSAGALYILRLIAKGPDTEETPPQTNEPPGSPLGAAMGEA